MNDFDATWKAAVRFRRASWELQGLLRDVHASFADPAALKDALVRLLSFLAGESGRTDANCTTTYYFISATEEQWRDVPAPLRAILDDMSGTLQDSIHAPQIARTFEATPEQLLERLNRGAAGS